MNGTGVIRSTATNKFIHFTKFKQRIWIEERLVKWNVFRSFTNTLERYHALEGVENNRVNLKIDC